MNKKQTVNKQPNGQFAKGNKLGNRWKKGQSGNPKGRRSAYSDLIKQYSFTKIDDVERRDKVVGKLFQLAERGDMRAIQFIIERLEGKSREFKEVTHKSEPIQIMSID
tara:strand:- start:2309 stop:2632 length:324 start_codon:yes stop_codon:yes gene_type:complete